MAHGNYLYVLLTKYLQNQGVVKPFIFVGGFVLLSSIMVHYIAVFVLNLGLLGAAGALAFSQVLQPVVCLALIRYKKLATETWHGWSWQSLHQWSQFLRLALPGTVMVCAEWWSFEIVFFISGAISTVDLAANIVFFQTLSCLFMIALGVSIAISIRVGTYLGANKPLFAKRAAWVGVKLIALWALFISLLLVVLRSEVGYIYSSDSKVINLVAKTMPVVALLTVFDYVQTIVQGIFRGAGRQRTGAILNTVGFYFVGLPIGIPLALALHWGVFGLWTGMCVGVIALTTVGVVLTMRFDWQLEAKKARIRAGVAHLPSDTNESFDKSDTDDIEFIGLEVIEARNETDVTGDSEVLLKKLTSRCGDLESNCEAEIDSVDVENETVVLHDRELSMSRSEKRKLLLRRFIAILIGSMLLVASGLASHYKSYQHTQQDLCSTNDTDRVAESTLSTTNTSLLLTIMPTSVTKLPEGTASTATRSCFISSSVTLEQLYKTHQTAFVVPSPTAVVRDTDKPVRARFKR